MSHVCMSTKAFTKILKQLDIIIYLIQTFEPFVGPRSVQGLQSKQLRINTPPKWNSSCITFLNNECFSSFFFILYEEVLPRTLCLKMNMIKCPYHCVSFSSKKLNQGICSGNVLYFKMEIDEHICDR